MKFCVVGTGRCGTSFMQRLLTAHPEAFVFNETHAIPTMYERYGSTRAPTRDLVQMLLDTRFISGDCIIINNAVSAGFSQDEFLTSLKKLVKQQPQMTIRECWQHVSQLIMDKAGKHCWGDKTPDYGAYMTLLQSLWPDVKFIHMIRNGVPTASSMMGHNGFIEMVRRGRDSWSSLAIGSWQPIQVKAKELTIHDFFALWARRLAKIKDEAGQLAPASYYEFSYEDLLLKTAETLTEIVGVLGLDADQQWLNHCERQVTPESLAKLQALSYTEANLQSKDQLAISLMKEYGYLP